MVPYFYICMDCIGDFLCIGAFLLDYNKVVVEDIMTTDEPGDHGCDYCGGFSTRYRCLTVNDRFLVWRS